MEVVVLHTVLKEGCEADYDRIHRVIPEEVAAALRKHGVSEWRIWRDGRDVFHLVEAEDFAAMRAGLGDLPANIAWQGAVGPFFDRPDDYSADPVAGFVWSLSAQNPTLG